MSISSGAVTTETPPTLRTWKSDSAIGTPPAVANFLWPPAGATLAAVTVTWSAHLRTNRTHQGSGHDRRPVNINRKKSSRNFSRVGRVRLLLSGGYSQGYESPWSAGRQLDNL